MANDTKHFHYNLQYIYIYIYIYSCISSLTRVRPLWKLAVKRECLWRPNRRRTGLPLRPPPPLTNFEITVVKKRWHGLAFIWLKQQSNETLALAVLCFFLMDLKRLKLHRSGQSTTRAEEEAARWRGGWGEEEEEEESKWGLSLICVQKKHAPRCQLRVAKSRVALKPHWEKCGGRGCLTSLKHRRSDAGSRTISQL